MILQKGTGNAGRILSKAAQISSKVLDGVQDVAGPLASMNPAFQAARMAINVASIAGKAGQEIGTARNLQSVGKSLGDAYGAADKVANPAPGAESLETAA